MPRSRSKSPKRDRKRSRSRERDRDRHRRHRRSRSRSRDKSKRSRSRDRDRDRRHGRDDRNRGRRPMKPRHDDSGDEDMVIYQNIDRVPMPEEEIQNMPADEQDLMRVMGFSGFDTTKNKQVVGNNQYSANICKKRRYRQYMNRKGGFNRPLDFIA